MNTVQTNVRVHPDDKQFIRAVATRLRADPHFRKRLKSLLEEDPGRAPQERIDRLEERVAWLLGIVGQSRPVWRASATASNGGRGPAAG